jgi:tol-pal system protein YbgF
VFFSVSRLLVASGLVILAAPVSFTVTAQTYVDLEAERAAAEAAGGSATARTNAPTPTDPYGAKPAQAYPATSYGVNNAPAASGGIAPASTPTIINSRNTAPAGSSSGQNLGALFSQIQRLQQEVMLLNGKLEEQTHELQRLKEQSLQRYTDLDQRLSGGASSAAKPGAGASASNLPLASAPVSGRSGKAAPEQPGETAAYRAAYGLVQGKQFEQAIPAFKQFIQSYPSSQYAANAHYWLGELYLVKQPPDLEASRQSFALLLNQYPDSPKAPDALYKLGKVQFMKGNREKAREYLDLVIVQYDGKNNTVVKLARDFIAENY